MAEKNFRPMLTYADEAHRLNEKSGMFHNMGENQIKELIHSSICSVFFLLTNIRESLWMILARLKRLKNGPRKKIQKFLNLN